MTIVTQVGHLFRPEDVQPERLGRCTVRTFVTPGRGSEIVAATRIDIPAGETWSPDAHDLETIGVVFGGRGEVAIAGRYYPVRPASTFYSQAGVPFALTGYPAENLVVYLWRAVLPSDRQPGRGPRLVSSLFDDATSFRPRLEDGTPFAPAIMSFLHWPGTGSPMLSLHCGTQLPRQSFVVHQHPRSEELFIGFRGEGEVFLNGGWHPFRAGDVLFAPPGLRHGARNPRPDGEPFITCGGPVPFDPWLYRLAGVSPDVR